MEEEKSNSADFPSEEIKYQLIVEEMKQLIPFLKEEMKVCPTEDLVFTLIETVDFYTLKRFFRLKSNISSNNKSLFQFKESLLANISTLDSFIAIPKKNSFALDASNNKGNQFKSPKVYNTEGDESIIDFGSGESILFLYDNASDLNLFLEKNQNMKIACFCLGVNLNFFEQKKYLKNHGYLNRNNLYFYFTEFEGNKPNFNTSLKLTNLPRALFVDSDNIIREDKYIKNIYNFNIERDLINYYENKSNKNEDQIKKDSNFVLLENENKRKIIKAMNIYLKEAGLDNVHFYVKSKISIDKKGIKKTRCYPVFYGDTNKEGKELVDNLIKELNGQELFNDFQNEVSCGHVA
jgi:hypothetical protein